MKRSLAITFASLLIGCVGCAAPSIQRENQRTQIATSTAVLADIARHIVGDQADVHSLLPPGADPHIYEPTLRSLRTAANADVIFTNHLLLEEQAMMKAITAIGVPHIAVSERSESHGAELIPLVEDASLDTVWLGMRSLFQLNSTGDTELKLIDVRGPGAVFAFLIGTFGTPSTYFDSSDGFDNDTVSLPVGAHTHMSWAFTKPGYYELDIASGEHTATVSVAVGVDAHQLSKEVVDSGHHDIAVGENGIVLYGDAAPTEDKTPASTNVIRELDATVISVPNTALQEIPGSPAFRFLGRGEIFMLPQAVLGKHVHGEIDPHTWLDVRNVIAWVEVMREELSRIDPANAATYAHNAHAYTQQLQVLHEDITTQLASLAPSRRYLITTHDAYGYFAQAYGFTVAGFVSPNPSIEPSTRELTALSNSIKNLQVPAVFVEPGAASPHLRSIAADNNVSVCTIYSDAFSGDVHTYIDLMRTNATTIKDCLQ
ncbi:metal ion ABC transporter substrate-binding protein [Corynebacterium kutscheri]|uniref:anchored repeat ABC transporter, substrate-binding protein n=1 Tax=Corynebacterium kutscheri TaxID=35755 RepID=UPI000F6DABB8|nr:anchored repeat ABC transporter, substrate-binding protein [Corynebacterium kutscheri]VEH81985.1 metal ion ABC transporter substrate-binding protein [Corynebacterium kutscheri]